MVFPVNGMAEIRKTEITYGCSPPSRPWYEGDNKISKERNMCTISNLPYILICRLSSLPPSSSSERSMYNILASNQFGFQNSHGNESTLKLLIPKPIAVEVAAVGLETR